MSWKPTGFSVVAHRTTLPEPKKTDSDAAGTRRKSTAARGLFVYLARIDGLRLWQTIAPVLRGC